MDDALVHADAVGEVPGLPVADQFVTFNAGSRTYGVDIMAVREIRSWSPTTSLPDAPAGSCGVLDIRGSIVEVYDLSVLVGGPILAARSGQVVVVVALEGSNVGILVDGVSDIIFAQPSDFRQPPAVGRDARSRKIAGLVRQEDRLITILNLAALFPAMPGETWVID